MSTHVRDNPRHSRYELVVEDQVVGVAAYRDTGEALVFSHTEIEPSMRGRGLGVILVQGALDAVRREGRSVIPSCWYVDGFINQHPEYRDLLASET